MDTMGKCKAPLKTVRLSREEKLSERLIAMAVAESPTLRPLDYTDL
jgi:hypothetical protein